MTLFLSHQTTSQGNKLKTTLLAVGYTLFFAFTIAFYTLKPSLPKPAKYHPQPIFNTHRTGLEEEPFITGFELTEYNAGKKVFTVKAEKFYLRNKKIQPFGFRIATAKSADLEKIEATFYKDNKPVSYLYSKTGIMDRKSKNIIFNGRPGLITEDKKTLSAQKITWDNAHKRLLAEGRCVVGIAGNNQIMDSVNTDIELSSFTVTDKDKEREKNEG